jgi:hypothetical protein
VIAAAALLPSCAPNAAHPLATAADTVLDDRLRGRWVISGFPQDSAQSSRVDVGSGRGSTLIARDSTSYREMGLRFVRLGGRWFVDAQLESAQTGEMDADDLAEMRKSKQMHVLMRLEISADSIEARAFEGSSLAGYHRQHPGEFGLKEVSSMYSTSYILTDKTPALRRFVARIATVDSMFHDSGPAFGRPH